jgi:hypothetical protein
MIPLALFEGDDARAIIIQCEQYGGTIHLFIGTRRIPSKNIFMALTCIYDPNTNQ